MSESPANKLFITDEVRDYISALYHLREVEHKDVSTTAMTYSLYKGLAAFMEKIAEYDTIDKRNTLKNYLVNVICSKDETHTAELKEHKINSFIKMIEADGKDKAENKRILAAMNEIKEKLPMMLNDNTPVEKCKEDITKIIGKYFELSTQLKLSDIVKHNEIREILQDPDTDQSDVKLFLEFFNFVKCKTDTDCKDYFMLTEQKGRESSDSRLNLKKVNEEIVLLNLFKGKNTVVVVTDEDDSWMSHFSRNIYVYFSLIMLPTIGTALWYAYEEYYKTTNPVAPETNPAASGTTSTATGTSTPAPAATGTSTTAGTEESKKGGYQRGGRNTLKKYQSYGKNKIGGMVGGEGMLDYITFTLIAGTISTYFYKKFIDIKKMGTSLFKAGLSSATTIVTLGGFLIWAQEKLGDPEAAIEDTMKDSTASKSAKDKVKKFIYDNFSKFISILTSPFKRLYESFKSYWDDPKELLKVINETAKKHSCEFDDKTGKITINSENKDDFLEKIKNITSKVSATTKELDLKDFEFFIFLKENEKRFDTKNSADVLQAIAAFVKLTDVKLASTEKYGIVYDITGKIILNVINKDVFLGDLKNINITDDLKKKEHDIIYEIICNKGHKYQGIDNDIKKHFDRIKNLCPPVDSNETFGFKYKNNDINTKTIVEITKPDIFKEHGEGIIKNTVYDNKITDLRQIALLKTICDDKFKYEPATSEGVELKKIYDSIFRLCKYRNNSENQFGIVFTTSGNLSTITKIYNQKSEVQKFIKVLEKIQTMSKVDLLASTDDKIKFIIQTLFEKGTKKVEYALVLDTDDNFSESSSEDDNNKINELLNKIHECLNEQPDENEVSEKYHITWKRTDSDRIIKIGNETDFIRDFKKIGVNQYSNNDTSSTQFRDIICTKTYIGNQANIQELFKRFKLICKTMADTENPWKVLLEKDNDDNMKIVDIKQDQIDKFIQVLEETKDLNTTNKEQKFILDKIFEFNEGNTDNNVTFVIDSNYNTIVTSVKTEKINNQLQRISEINSGAAPTTDFAIPPPPPPYDDAAEEEEKKRLLKLEEERAKKKTEITTEQTNLVSATAALDAVEKAISDEKSRNSSYTESTDEQKAVEDAKKAVDEIKTNIAKLEQELSGLSPSVGGWQYGGAMMKCYKIPNLKQNMLSRLIKFAEDEESYDYDINEETCDSDEYDFSGKAYIFDVSNIVVDKSKRADCTGPDPKSRMEKLMCLRPTNLARRKKINSDISRVWNNVSKNLSTPNLMTTPDMFQILKGSNFPSTMNYQLGGADIDESENFNFIKTKNSDVKIQYSYQIITLLKKALQRLNSNGVYLEAKTIKEIQDKIDSLRNAETSLAEYAEDIVNAGKISQSRSEKGLTMDASQLHKYVETHRRLSQSADKTAIKLNTVFIKLLELVNNRGDDIVRVVEDALNKK